MSLSDFTMQLLSKETGTGALASALTGYSSGGQFSCVVQDGSGDTRINHYSERTSVS